VTAYLGGVFGMTGLCVFFPSLGLSLFLAISAIHFSEGETNATTPPSPFMGTAWGVSAILLPIGLHTAEAQDYMRYFVPHEVFAEIAAPLQTLSYIVASLLALSLIISLQRKRNESSEYLQRSLCLIAWIILPPLAGFAVWFIGRHSRQHLEACREMFSQRGIRIPLDFAVISALAILGLLPFALYFDFSRIEQLFAASLCLIAGLTLPHMVVSHRMKESLGS
jgi:Brp/Blh family beta-carotene 15,15'-monooxygenase